MSAYIPFTQEELAELAAYDAEVDDSLDYDRNEVAEQRARDLKFLDDRLDPKQLSKRKCDREYYQNHKDRINERNRVYAEAHAEQIRSYRREYYRQHAADTAERKKAYQAAYREPIAEYHRQYHLNHKEEHNAYSRQYYQDHLEASRDRSKRWRESHKDYLREYRKANRERDNAKARARYAAKKAAAQRTTEDGAATA